MDRFVEDSDGVAAANQRRMNADPFETLLINMGYDIQGIQYSMSRGISFATVQNAWFQKRNVPPYSCPMAINTFLLNLNP